MYVADWLSRRARCTPGRTALILEPGGQRFTYAELDRRAARGARVLGALGVGPGDRVILLAENGPVHLDLLFGCARLGAILVPLNWRLAPPELALLLDDAAPRVLVWGPGFTAVADGAAAQGVSCVPLAGAPDWEERLAAAPDFDLPEPAAGGDDPWMILYTGGTTGRPKGAVLTYASVAANALNTIAGWQLRPDDVVPIALPLFHTGGLNVFTTPLLALGGTIVLTRGSFDPGLVLDIIEQHRASLVFLVPTMFQSVLAHPRFGASDWSSVRFCISGGAPCPLPVYQGYWDKGLVFKQGYGLTEAGPNNFAMPDHEIRRKAGSVGLPILGAAVRLVDGDGRPVPPGAVGEVTIAGPHLCRGYWRDPAATAEAIRDGWLHTGDLAYRDAEGYYYIVDRKKDMFISGGENVYPAEVEAALYTHPAVAECAVVGVPDPAWGEVGRAFVVLRPGAAAAADELRQHLRARLAGFKVPKTVEFRAALPKSAAGKILKRELRQD